MKKLGIFLFILVAFIACNNAEQNSDTPDATYQPSVTNQPVDTAVQSPSPSTNPVVPSVINPATNSNNTSTVALNPEHGKPGHRCDISVGAPLNSKPNQQTTNNANPVVPTISAPTTQQPVSQTVAPGMNPQHGQPGHRCDISVGAPLNSKPVVTNPTVTLKNDSSKS